jgi:hypothetical protein
LIFKHPQLRDCFKILFARHEFGERKEKRERAKIVMMTIQKKKTHVIVRGILIVLLFKYKNTLE